MDVASPCARNSVRLVSNDRRGILVVALRERTQSVGGEGAGAEQRIGVGRARECLRDLLARLRELTRAVPIPRPVPVPEQRIRESECLFGA